MDRLALLLAPLLALGACAEYPQVGAAADPAAQNAPYPALVPLGPVLAQAAALAPPPEAPADRIATLQARAAALRGSVIAPKDRARLARGADTGALTGAR